jgi:hypothetical protein
MKSEHRNGTERKHSTKRERHLAADIAARRYKFWYKQRHWNRDGLADAAVCYGVWLVNQNTYASVTIS